MRIMANRVHRRWEAPFQLRGQHSNTACKVASSRVPTMRVRNDRRTRETYENQARWTLDSHLQRAHTGEHLQSNIARKLVSYSRLLV